MSLLNRSLAAAAVAFALSGSAALAYPADATIALKLHAGPGETYRVVGSLTPGHDVEVHHCATGWCYITDDTHSGWVAASHLSPLQGLSIAYASA